MPSASPGGGVKDLAGGHSGEVDETARPHPSPPADWRHGRLLARPGQATAEAEAPGLHQLATGLLYVPAAPPDRPRQLLVVLHGAGGSARQALDLLRRHADDRALLLLCPQSAGSTWDVIAGGYGPDVRRIDDALAHVFARFRVDPADVAVAGFSDGASYALSLAVANGDLLTAALAFSPGFLAPLLSTGRPRFFISHGVSDRVLPVERCSRRVVPALRAAGYNVTYEEFAGGHEVPAGTVSTALDWLER